MFNKAVQNNCKEGGHRTEKPQHYLLAKCGDNGKPGNHRYGKNGFISLEFQFLRFTKNLEPPQEVVVPGCDHLKCALVSEISKKWYRSWSPSH